MVIFVLCDIRSGTSFYARSLAVMGAYFGEHVRTETMAVNLQGNYENNLATVISNRLYDIIEPNKRGRTGIINKIYWKALSFRKTKAWRRYHTFAFDPDWVFPKDKTYKDMDILTAAAMKYLLTDLDKGGAGVIKQPGGMAFGFPFWRSMAEHLGIEYKIAIVFRDPVATTKSKINLARHTKRKVMSERLYHLDWSIKHRHFLGYAAQARERGIDVFWSDFNWPEEIRLRRLEGDCARLGLSYDFEAASRLFDPSQKRYSADYEAIKASVDPETMKVYDELLKRSK